MFNFEIQLYSCTITVIEYFVYHFLLYQITYYGRRHLKLFTNCHDSWDNLYITNKSKKAVTKTNKKSSHTHATLNYKTERETQGSYVRMPRCITGLRQILFQPRFFQASQPVLSAALSPIEGPSRSARPRKWLPSITLKCMLFSLFLVYSTRLAKITSLDNYLNSLGQPVHLKINCLEQYRVQS